MTDKIVSVIIPVYNGENYLKKCVESVVKQSYKNIEIIIINDGSKDRTIEIGEELVRTDDRIKLINQPNSGPSKARNKGIENARGYYLQFVDVDDTIKPTMIETLVSLMEGQTDLVICGFDTVDLRKNEIISSNNCGELNTIMDKAKFLESFVDLYDLTILRQLWNKIYKCSIIKSKSLCFDEGISNAEDLLFNLSYYENCQNIKFIEKPLYNYSIGNTSSLTSNYKKNFYRNRKEIYIEIFKFLEKNNIISNGKFHRDFINEVDKCFLNLFHSNSNLDKEQLMSEILYILRDDFLQRIIINVDNIYHKLDKHKILSYLIYWKKTKTTYYYYYMKNIINRTKNFIGG